MNKKKPLADYARYSALGLQMAAMIVLCTFAGKYLDSLRSGGFPVFTVTGIILGVFASMYYMIRQIK